jgi:hypothetical protein
MQYITSPFKPMPALNVSGTPTYLLGSYNDKASPTFGYVVSDSAVTTTGTVTFRITSGNVPFVGALISVVGTANASGNFNVTNATILTVTCTDAGICTVTYAITSSTVALGTADGGQVQVPQPELGETLVNGSSVPVAMTFQGSHSNQEKDIVAIVSFPGGLPTTALVTLQSAIIDLDSEYADVATVTSVAGGVQSGGQISIDQQAARFYRFHTSTVAGPAAKIVAKLVA